MIKLKDNIKSLNVSNCVVNVFNKMIIKLYIIICFYNCRFWLLLVCLRKASKWVNGLWKVSKWDNGLWNLSIWDNDNKWVGNFFKNIMFF